MTLIEEKKLYFDIKFPVKLKVNRIKNNIGGGRQHYNP